MGLISWLRDKLGRPVTPGDIAQYSDEYDAIVGDIYVRELAFWSAVNLISHAISKCEFKTFADGKEVKGREHYLWNVEPNQNQNSSAFIQRWISTLYRNNEALIIENNGRLYVADSFQRKQYALFDDVFTQVAIGDYTFNRSFLQSEVLYFSLGDCDMRRVICGLYESYSRLIAYTMKSYQKSRGTKAKFKYASLPPAGTEDRQKFDDLISKRFKAYLEADSAILPLGNGQDIVEATANKAYANDTTRDIKAQIDDVFDFTAKAFGIPAALLRGEVQGTSDAVDLWLTACIDPLTDMLQEEINRKRNGFAGYSRGTYLKIDTKAIKHVDLLSVSTAIDKLISSGAFCVNDIRKLVGETEIAEPWASQHFITKNYVPFDEALTAGGGEK